MKTTYQKLFNYMSESYGVTLMESDMIEIERILTPEEQPEQNYAQILEENKSLREQILCPKWNLFSEKLPHSIAAPILFILQGSSKVYSGTCSQENLCIDSNGHARWNPELWMYLTQFATVERKEQ